MVGCVYHVFEVTRVFLAFQTKIDFSFDSTSEIVVPMVSFCMPTGYALKNKLPFIFNFDTPSTIDNQTYDVTRVFSVCSSGKLEECKIENDTIRIEKMINYENICYTFKYPESNKSMSRELLKIKNGLIYSFILIHHQELIYQLYLTSEYNVPNGDSLNFYGISGNLIY